MAKNSNSGMNPLRCDCVCVSCVCLVCDGVSENLLRLIGQDDSLPSQLLWLMSVRVYVHVCAVCMDRD